MEKISLATYEREYERLRQELAAVLPPVFEGVEETTWLEWLLPPDADTKAALRITKRMRALTRLTFSRLDE